MCMLTAMVPTRRLAAWEAKSGLMLLTNLLLMNASSGNRDGTGLATVSGDVFKEEQPATEFCLTKPYNNWVKANIRQPLIGHVRASSTGLQAKDGAHPFRVGNIVLAHNGTFTNYQQLMGNVKLDDDDPVDSHVIAAILSDRVGDGVLSEDILLEVLGEVTGSYALLIVDAKAKVIWVATASNQLHLQKQGPYLLINTSSRNLDSMGDLLSGYTDLLFDHTWDVEKPEKVGSNAIYTVDKDGLHQRAAIPVKEVYTPSKGLTRLQWRGSTATLNDKIDDDGITLEEAGKRALAMLHLSNVNEYVSESDVRVAIYTLFKESWVYASVSAIDALAETMDNIFSCDDIEEKSVLWAEINKLTKGAPYSSVSRYTNIEFPWPLNSIDALTKIIEQLKDDMVTVEL